MLASTLPLRKPDHRRLWINRSDTPYGTLYQQAIRSTAGVGAPLAGLNCAATRAERHQPIAMDAGEIAERECPGGNLVRRQQRRSPDLLGLNFRSIIARYAHFPCRLPPRSSPSAHPAGIAMHSGYGQSYASLRALLAACLPRRCTEKPHLNDLPARGYSALDMAGAVCAADLLSSSVRDRRACSCASSRSLPRALGLRPAFADLVLTDILPLSTCYLPPAPQARAGLNPYPFSTIPSNGSVG